MEQFKKHSLSGKEALFAVLQKENIPILTQTEFDEKTGNEIILTVDYPADKIKELTTELEENHPFGRLFDMDVIGTDGEKLSRGVYRKCLICGCQAQDVPGHESIPSLKCRRRSKRCSHNNIEKRENAFSNSILPFFNFHHYISENLFTCSGFSGCSPIIFSIQTIWYQRPNL